MVYKKTASIGTAVLVALGVIVYNGISAFSAQPEMHRGFVSQNVLTVLGHTYKVRYSCRRANAAYKKAPAMTFLKGFMGSHVNEFLAWNDKDAIIFARKAFPDCGIVKLEEVLFRNAYKGGGRHRKERAGTRLVIG